MRNEVKHLKIRERKKVRIAMMIEDKVNEIIKLFYIVDSEIHHFKKESGLRCLRFCSRCCSSNIHATVLEFLPLAYWIYQKKAGHDWLIKLREAEAQGSVDTDCFLLRYPMHRKNSGRCIVYKMRPLVCRLFGFSALLDKHRQPQFVTCRTIKTAYRENYIEVLRSIGKVIQAPVMKNYYTMLYSIDPHLARDHYPIRVAFRMALETVLTYFTYQQNGVN